MKGVRSPERRHDQRGFSLAELSVLLTVIGSLCVFVLPAFLSYYQTAQVRAAAYDVARTVCRRAERNVVRLVEAGEAVEPNVLAYLNRLSDLLWLFGRKLEFEAGVNGSLRAATEIFIHPVRETGRARALAHPGCVAVRSSLRTLGDKLESSLV